MTKSEYMQKYYQNQENKEKRRKYSRRYYADHRDQVINKQKEYATRNKEKLQEYRRRNKETRQKNSKKWYEENQDKVKEYRMRSKSKPKIIFADYERGARKRNLDFLLTFEEFMTFWQKSCTYCKNPIEKIGIDRADNTRGYILDNCVSCCARCNWMKLDMTIREFVEHCKKISQYENK